MKIARTLLMILTLSIVFGQVIDPGILWSRCYGTSSVEAAFSIETTRDDGFIVAGISGGDPWVIKLLADGEVAWRKHLGGSTWDEAASVAETFDGGYIIAGTFGNMLGDKLGFDNTLYRTRIMEDADYKLEWTKDFNNDVSHDKYKELQSPRQDLLLVKLNSLGAVQWEKHLGGSYHDGAREVKQTADGGFILAGYTESNNYDVQGASGATDFWVVKTDDDGDIEWRKVLGGKYDDIANSVAECPDGGYIAAGFSWTDDEVNGRHIGNRDFRLVKFGRHGEIIWDERYGGSEDDIARSIVATADSGYVIAGFTESNDGNVSGNHGRKDFWVMKLNKVGSVQWSHCYGGSKDDIAESIYAARGGGFIIAGSTESSNGDIVDKKGSKDMWLVRIDKFGKVLWQKTLGGSKDDIAYSICQTSGGHFAIAGFTQSKNGDVEGWHEGKIKRTPTSDLWVVKLFPETLISN